MEFNRRSFLSQTAFGLLTLGVSQSELMRIAQTFAATTPRKLALLVGINNYGEENNNLKGCVTDVERQQELLIYRFGFNPSDIVTLTDQQATRDGIETAFSEHLIAQAQPGDVVLFHFSGYGNQIKLNSGAEDEQTINSFLPSNGLLKKKPIANEIIEETILLLGRSLSTNQVTMVLDTSHATDGNLRKGNLRTRSFPVTSSEINPEELSLQGRLKTLQKHSPIPGMILSASRQNQIATEIIGDNWSAGMFTYALTQYLWQVTSASQIYVTLNRISEQVEQLTGLQQQPQLLKNSKSRLTYDLIPQVVGAEGIITSLPSEKTAELSLTGLPASLVDEHGISSCFVVTSSLGLEKDFPSPENEVLQVTSRQGLMATSQRISPTSSLEVGQTVQEWIRVLPRQIELAVALDSSLSRIERVDATSALATKPIPNTIITKGEQKVDCILSKIVSKPPKTVNDPDQVISPSTASDAPLEMGSYRLLSVGGTPIPSTVGLDNEAVKSAVQRLIPQFKTLLAAKLWRLTCNEGSSRLPIVAHLDQLTPTPQNLLRRNTRLTTDAKPTPLATEALFSIPQIPIDTEIQYRLVNDGQRPIYCLLMGIDANGNGFTLSLPRTESETETSQLGQLHNQMIASGETLILPNIDRSTWRVAGPMGLTEIYLICSRRPFEKTLKVLETSQVFNHERNPIFTLAQPLDVAQAILDDLDQASAVERLLLNNSPDSYALDVNAWATLTFIYQVVG